MQKGLYSIGRLSKTANVSIDTIRYYGDIGLLKPAYISDTGYRYYADEQAAALARIKELKSFGFSLNEIKAMSPGNSEALMNFYQSRYWELLGEREKLQEVIDKLSEKIKHQQEVRSMKKRILLVDDANFMRNICAEFLTKGGYEIAGEAADGMECLEKYKELKPDLVLLDITMPEYDGRWVLRKLKEYDADANVVMLTAMGFPQAVADCLMAGAKHFIVKPFQADFILEVVRGVFQDEEKPFDRGVLERIVERVHSASFVDMMSQDEINEVLRIARRDALEGGLDEALLEVLKGSGGDFSVSFGGLDAFDEVPALLRQILEGQERMVGLLERLVEGEQPAKK